MDGAPIDETATEGARFVRVGTAVLRSPLPFGSTANLGEAAGSRRAPPTLLAGDVSAMALMPGLTTSYRTFNWSEPLPLGHPQLGDRRPARPRGARPLGAGDRRHQLGAVRPRPGADRGARQRPGRRPADAAGRRRGGRAAARLHRAGGRRPAPRLARPSAGGWSGAAHGHRSCWSSRWPTPGWVALVGVAVGAAIGLLVAAFAAAAAGHRRLGPAAPLDPGLGGRRRADRLLGGGHRAAGDRAARAIGARLGQGCRPGGARRRPPRPRALARGGTSAGDLAGRSNPLLPAMPCSRRWSPASSSRGCSGWAMRNMERLARRGPMSLRLAALSLARDPGPAAITAGFLAVAFGLGILASSYRATLEGGQRDEAAYAVPADVIAREGAALVRPLDVAPITEWLAARRPEGAAGAPTAGVDRRRRRLQRLDPGARRAGVRRCRRCACRATASSRPRSPAACAGAGRSPPTAPISRPGPVSLPVTLRGAPVTLALIVEDAGGAVTSVPMGLASGGGRCSTAPSRGGPAGGGRARARRGRRARRAAPGRRGRRVHVGRRHARAGEPDRRRRARSPTGRAGSARAVSTRRTAARSHTRSTASTRTLFRGASADGRQDAARCWSARTSRTRRAGGSLGLSFGGRTVPGPRGRRGRPLPDDRRRQLRRRRRELAGIRARRRRSWRRPAAGAVAGHARPRQVGRPAARARPATLRRARVRVVRRHAQPAATDPLARGILVALEAGALLALALALGGLLLSVASAVRATSAPSCSTSRPRASRPGRPAHRAAAARGAASAAPA